MSGTAGRSTRRMTGGYRALFRHPGAVRLALGGLVGRLPVGMLGLAFILVLRDTAGSYAMGGLAAGGYLITAAVCVPLWSRAADRVGPRPVLLTTGLGQACVLVTFALLAGRDAGAAVLVTLAAATGVLLPPLGAVMRALWSTALADEPDAKRAAFACESLVMDLAFVIGPTLVAGIAALTGAAGSLLCAAAATVTGCLTVAASARVSAVSGRRLPDGAPRPGPLRDPAQLALLLIGFLLMGSVNLTEMSLVASADAAGHRHASGPLIAALACGSLIGGFGYGGRRWRAGPARRLALLLAALAAGWAVPAAVGNLWALGALLALAGLALTPAITAQYETLDGIAARGSLTESFGWLNAAGAAGMSAGAAVAGLLAGTPAHGFLLAAASCALACALACGCRGVWHGRAEPAESVSLM
ncbi:MFS transporter [Streptomyces albireticuli]